jgi:hypothetical protein
MTRPERRPAPPAEGQNRPIQAHLAPRAGRPKTPFERSTPV